MTFKEINERFTKTVAGLLMDGYKINAETMSGTQGEIAHIDMTDGEEVLRVLVESFCEYGGDTNHHRFEGIHIVVGRCTDRVRINGKGVGDIVWNNHLEILSEEKFYRIGYRDAWYGTQEEAQEAAVKQRERYGRQDAHRGYGWELEEDLTTEETVEAVLPKVCREFGLKRPRKDDVVVGKYIHMSGLVQYRVGYRNTWVALK